MKLIRFFLIIGSLLISACTSKTDATEGNFKDAISSHIEAIAEKCLKDSNEYPFHSWDLALADTNETFVDLSDAIELKKHDVSSRILNSNLGMVDGAISTHDASSFSDSEIKEIDSEVGLEDLAGKPIGKKFKVKRYEYSNKKNFKFFIDEYLPREIPSGFEMNNVKYGDHYYNLRNINNYKLKVLEKVGLVKSGDLFQITSSWMISDKPNGLKFIHKLYTLTDAGRKFYRAKNGFCYGKPEFVRIEKWIGPKKLGEYQEVDVTYFVKTGNIADWAKTKEIQNFDDEIKNTLSGETEETVTLVLSNKGWDVK